MIESDIFELHVMIFRNKTENKNQSKTKKVNQELMENKAKEISAKLLVLNLKN